MALASCPARQGQQRSLRRMCQVFSWALARPPGDRSCACARLASFWEAGLFRPRYGVRTWSPAAAPGPEGLSPRERELATLVAQGRTHAQIAAQLYISVRTVSSHLDRIRDKTGCRRRADLTRLASAPAWSNAAWFYAACLSRAAACRQPVWVIPPRP